MHMLNKHSKIEGSEDFPEVTMAKTDATTPIPDPTTNPTINPTINPTTIEETAPICHHFQRGACNFGECCWKRHEPPDRSHLPVSCHNAAMCLITRAILSSK